MHDAQGRLRPRCVVGTEGGRDGGKGKYQETTKGIIEQTPLEIMRMHLAPSLPPLHTFVMIDMGSDQVHGLTTPRL